MLPRINVVLPDGPEPRRPLATGTAWSELRRAVSTGDLEHDVTLHEPTTQEMLQYELMRLKFDDGYEVKNEDAWSSRKFVLAVLKLQSNSLMMDVAQKVPDALRNDKDFILAALKLDPGLASWLRVSDELVEDPEIVAAFKAANEAVYGRLELSYEEEHLYD